MPSISRRIAEFVHRLKYEDLPANVVEEVKRYLYDSLGCAYGAFNTEDVKIMRKNILDLGGTPESTIIGLTEKVDRVNATLLNSLMIRSLDFNDIYWKQDPSHPSDLIPAALSVAEAEGKSGREVITGIVIAYEFEQRLCEFAIPGIRERKWHHATLTQFVSPLVAGKMMDLTVDQLVNAVGINSSHNHTIGCPTAGKLTMMKNTVDPMAVQSGVFAAMLARDGYTGTEEVFEGKEGFMDVYGPQWDESRLFDGLGKHYKILECSMKAFPTEALTHTHLSATLKLVREHDIKPEEVEEVIVTTIARACDILFDPQKYKPDSRETADHSLPYCLSVAIVDREVTTRSFSEEKLKDPRIWDVIDKIKGEASEEFEKLFPAKQPSRVIIRTKSGREYSCYLEYPKGDPREPLTMEDLESKFRALSADVLTSEKQDQIKEAIFNLEKFDDVRELFPILTVDK